MGFYQSFFRKMCYPLRWSMIGLIYSYRFLISPFLGVRCRFYPSCSQYAIEAIKAHGIFTGFWLVSKRLLKCHPGSTGGYDPIPKKQGLH